MKKQILLIVSLVLGLALVVNAQRPSRSNFTVAYKNRPTVPVAGVKDWSLKIYTAGLGISQDDLKGRKAYKALRQENSPTSYTPVAYTVKSENAGLNVEVAFGQWNMLNKEETSHEIPCKAKGADLKAKNIMKCPAYYYQVSYELPCVVRITDAAGVVLHAQEATSTGTTTFGYDPKGLSGYLVKSELQEAFAKTGEATLQQQAAMSQIAKAIQVAESNLYFSESQDKFKIASGTGKAHDYSELDKAQEQAIAAIEAKSFDQLKTIIPVWQNHLAKADLSDNDAMINKGIASALNENLALASMYLDQYDEAGKYVAEFLRIAKMQTNTNHQERAAELSKLIIQRKMGYTANSTVSIDNPQPAPDLAKSISDQLIPNLISSEDRYADFVAQAKSAQQAEEEAKQEILADMTTDNPDANPYRSMISGSATQGSMLIFSGLFHADLKGKPMPQEISELTELNQLLATGMEFTALPEDIGNLKNLSILNLSNNSLKELPESIGNLTELKKLILKNNQISSLPESIKNCKNLKSLVISGNNISDSELQKIQTWLPDAKIKN